MTFPEDLKPTVDYVLVDDEPLHVQRWRSTNVRLVCVQFPVHTTSLWHQHLNYGVYVVMAPLNVTEQSYGSAVKSLIQDRGAVFCRDHTKDHLLHVVTTTDSPLFIVEVELLKPKADLKPHADIPIHAAKGIELLNDEPECRVYRLTLEKDSLNEAASEITLTLPTEAVLLAVADCIVKVNNTTVSGEQNDFVQHLKVGDDIVLSEGQFDIELVGEAGQTTTALFILTEVY